MVITKRYTLGDYRISKYYVIVVSVPSCKPTPVAYGLIVAAIIFCIGGLMSCCCLACCCSGSGGRRYQTV